MLQRIYVGAATGGLMAGVTCAVSTIEGISNNAVVGMVKPVAMALIIPGLLGSAIMGGNIHAYSLGIASVINGIIYFALGCFLYPVVWAGLRKLLQR